MSDLVKTLEGIVGGEHLRAGEGTRAYAVDGVIPAVAVFPGDVDEVSAVLAACSKAGAAVVPWGGGAHMGLGGVPKKVDVVLALGRMNQVLDHEPGDMTSTVQAGMALSRFPVATGSPRTVPGPGSAGRQSRHDRGDPGGQRQRPAPPALRGSAGPAHRPPRRACRRHGDEGRGQGRQERHRLRHEQALRRIAGHPGRHRGSHLPAVSYSACRAHLGRLVSYGGEGRRGRCQDPGIADRPERRGTLERHGGRRRWVRSPA